MLRILLFIGLSHAQSQKRLPDAIIFGVRKGGTRALLEFVEINSKVSAAGPEIHFFDRDANYNQGFSWYREQMPEATEDQLVIEKTPRYFVVKKAVERMQELQRKRQEDCDRGFASKWTCKPLKLVLIVREPVSRLISGYTQIQDKRLKLNKEPGPELEQEVFKNGDPAQGKGQITR
ncbi:Oidioi.mRNA.OKI2018_I69.PAR.g10696.t1.cds [Oikopleura dioica]|uniref:Sulfotransferase n=1 Tax=Oikopleura dioica TaxID=34765 RepID=A0ABN7RVH2_OIKDI|nr:Oidioi.mRNA.OKI2018_I69.PAR.g10696.t1.cds [Oikopleura dioica]